VGRRRVHHPARAAARGVAHARLAGADSQIIIPIDPVWKRSREIPDSYRFLLAVASPAGVQAIPALVEKARLQQTRVTTELRRQARQAIELFIQEVLDHPDNRETLASDVDTPALAKELWREGLITVYRLLFILKLEASDDPARSFSFASTSLWRNTFSPNVALARYVSAVLDRGAETGHLLEDGLRTLFRMFAEGLQCTGLNVQPLGGALFGTDATSRLYKLKWGERAVAYLLDRLLWTPKVRGSEARERVHYGPLDVEDLGRVYEALLELEPGIAAEPMCRLRRQKLEVVVPIAQGEKYRPTSLEGLASIIDTEETEESDDTIDEADDEAVTRGRKTKIEWIEAIPPGRFYLRVGLGRKATGSYYTPHSFVRFLVQETLGPLVAERSPQEDPRPGEILKLKVLDPAMGSGHFLVEACRFLGEKLYEACRLCDERSLAAEHLAEQANTDAERYTALTKADEYRWRIQDLPDPDDELVRYLPSRAPEGEESGLSQKKAEALCRRLVAIHCLYGVDKNPLAVELAKLALWIESHAEGLPLTFLDHRLVLGDSLTGPFFRHLLKYPGTQEPLDDLFTRGLRESFTNALANALKYIDDLEATVGANLAEIDVKQVAKARLDHALAPFKIVVAAWAGGVMAGEEDCDDDAYAELVRAVTEIGDLPWELSGKPTLLRMMARGLGISDAPAERSKLLDLLTSGKCSPALPVDLTFPEVFYPQGDLVLRRGFDVVLGNPPWEGLDTSKKEFYGRFDIRLFDVVDQKAEKELARQLDAREDVRIAREDYEALITGYKNAARVYLSYINQGAAGASAATPDMYQCFAERGFELLPNSGVIGFVLPSAFHANESATGIRRLYLEGIKLHFCYSFENRRKLFEIDSRQKFAIIVASHPGPTKAFSCVFYLHDDEWLFQDDKGERLLQYTPDFLQRTTGDLRNFLELRSTSAVLIVDAMYGSKERSFGALRRDWGILPSEELHTSKQRYRTRPIAELAPGISGDPRRLEVLEALLSAGVLPVCKGEHFHQFDPLWGEPPDVGTTCMAMRDRQQRLQACRYYRLAFRQQASSINERTVISYLSPPGILYFHSALPERDPGERASWRALALIAIVNSFSFDWIVRQLVGANVTFNFLDTVPAPSVAELDGLLAHQSLLLTCNHGGYEALWHEQLGDAWREPKPPFTWPVLQGEDERWAVRAAIDAVVADSYDLSREQYAHVLSSFSHRSYGKAPELCLARFDELRAIGLERPSRRNTTPTGTSPSMRACPSLLSICLSLANLGLRPSLSRLLLRLNLNIAGLRFQFRPWKHRPGLERVRNQLTPRFVADVDSTSHPKTTIFTNWSNCCSKKRTSSLRLTSGSSPVSILWPFDLS
jgi:N-6 DNA Methylase